MISDIVKSAGNKYDLKEFLRYLLISKGWNDVYLF